MFLRTLIILSLTAPALAAPKVGETIKVRIDEVRPTQFSVGYAEVAIRLHKIEQAIEDDELKEFKKENPGEAIIGPEGELFLRDGHHFARALLQAGKSKMYVHIVADYHTLDWKQFWKRMRDKHSVFLLDEEGKEESPSALPKTFSALRDDPYRSLAWMAQKAHCYKELSELPFQEFAIAGFLRGRVKIREFDKAGWQRAVLDACKELTSSDREAKKLPGYHGETGQCSPRSLSWWNTKWAYQQLHKIK